MKITYIWHDSFVIETEEEVFLFDYWKDPSKILDIRNWAAKMVYVFVSHHHKDHFNRDIFKWSHEIDSGFVGIKYIISKDTARMVRYMLKAGTIYRGANRVDSSLVEVLQEGEFYEDERVKIYAFGSTDIGNSYLIAHSGRYIFHAGDLNAWVWKDESTESEIEAALSEFRGKIAPIRSVTETIDLAMFPVDSRIGRDYWEGASIFLREFEVHNFVPMHFGLDEDAESESKRIADAIAFDEYKNNERGEYHSLVIPGNSVEI